VVQRIVDFMDALPPVPVLFVLAVLVTPPLVVIHELGHALAALWQTDGPVFVRIGAKERGWALRTGRFSMEAGPSEVELAAGFCAYDGTRCSPVGRAVIAMSGPLASLIGAVAAALLWGATSGPVRDVFAAATLGGVLAGVINAMPLTFERTRNGTKSMLRLDGLHALEALRESRAPAPPMRPAARNAVAGPVAERWSAEVDAASERARAERARANAARLRARESTRQATSVPPPGFPSD
jgi:hypothetical protein